MTDSMVERVAAAIAEAGGTNWDGCLKAPGKVMHKMYMGMARAAIAAMRDPTKAMILAGDNCDDEGSPNDGDFGHVACAEEHYQVMIDEALK